MKKQTAVEWLHCELDELEMTKNKRSLALHLDLRAELFQQAKAMEKEQMDKVSEDWFVEGCSHMKDNKRIYKSFEQYYNQTYGK